MQLKTHTCTAPPSLLTLPPRPYSPAFIYADIYLRTTRLAYRIPHSHIQQQTRVRRPVHHPLPGVATQLDSHDQNIPQSTHFFAHIVASMHWCIHNPVHSHLHSHFHSTTLTLPSLPLPHPLPFYPHPLPLSPIPSPSIPPPPPPSPPSYP